MRLLLLQHVVGYDFLGNVRRLAILMSVVAPGGTTMIQVRVERMIAPRREVRPVWITWRIKVSVTFKFSRCSVPLIFLSKKLKALLNFALDKVTNQMTHLARDVQVVDRRNGEVAAVALLGAVSPATALLLLRRLSLLGGLLDCMLIVIERILVKCDALLALLELHQQMELDDGVQPLAQVARWLEYFEHLLGRLRVLRLQSPQHITVNLLFVESQQPVEEGAWVAHNLLCRCPILLLA